jgi:hypothetical protein
LELTPIGAGASCGRPGRNNGDTKLLFSLTEGVWLDSGLRMAPICKVVLSEFPHRVTQQGVRSIPIFQTNSERISYLDFLAEELNRFGVDVLAWSLMTNHVMKISIVSPEFRPAGKA